MSLPAGTKLGPYEILADIGSGGMGEVYQALDTLRQQIVAVKISDERFTARFGREARALAALNHPNICTLHDVGPNYLVMEYVQGKPLEGHLPLDQALGFAIQICGALDHAHNRGVIHRDLKPANVLVTKSGVKLLDFGLAKIRVAAGGDATRSMTLTAHGQFLGTLHYMAPEQLRGQEVDARTDLFSAGLVIYEMITGKRAFDGKNPARVMTAILHAEPAPLQDFQPLAPLSLDGIVRRCLRKDPELRWQNAQDLMRELEAVANGPATAAPARA